MADIVDIANDLRDSEIENTLKKRPSAEVAAGNGACLYCESALPFSQRWCDADCREDWEREQAAERNRVARAME